jgi:Arc/MetJ-type ribon-helix-helix transcriptional regulator
MSIGDIAYFRFDAKKDIAYYSAMMKAGRPAIGKSMPVRLSDEALRRIDALCPRGGRADFIRAAVDAELERRESAERAASIKTDPAALYAALAARKAGRTHS